MTKAYSLAFKQKMIERLTGKNAVNPSQLGREIGIRQQNLSRWLHEARSLPSVAANTPKVRVWTVEQKAQALAGASKLSGEQLPSYLEREGIKLADFERWRTTKRIRKLERELARKEKALAEAAVLLVLKKTIDSYYKEEDDDTDEPSEKSS
jgi:hypothetical protein